MTVASTPRNYLIHVYQVRDNLVPFDCEEEFCTFRDTLKAAILTESVQHGIDRELVVKGQPRRLGHHLLLDAVAAEQDPAPDRYDWPRDPRHQDRTGPGGRTLYVLSKAAVWTSEHC
jgi:hypothetical protein